MTVALAGPASAMSAKKPRNATAVQMTASPASAASTLPAGIADGQVSAANGAYTTAANARQAAVIPSGGSSLSLRAAISGPMA